MKPIPGARYLWSLAIPISLAALIVVRGITSHPGDTRATAPGAATAPVVPTETAPRPSGQTSALLIPEVRLAGPLPAVEAPAAAPGLASQAADQPTPTAPSPADPRFVAIEQQAQDGDVSQAEAQLRVLAKGNDRTVAARAQFLLGQTLLSNDDTNAGQQAYQQYLSQFPTGGDLPWVSFALGELAFQQGQRDQASTYLRQYLKMTTDHSLDGYAESDLAQIAQDSGNSATATSLLQRAVEAGLPLSSELIAASAVGKTMLAQGNPSAAAKWYGTLADRSSNDPATRAHYQFLEASTLQQAGDTSGAVAIFQQMIQNGTAGIDTGAVIAALKSLGHPVGNFAAGEALLKANQFGAAVQSLGDYLDQNPNGPDAATARYDRGRALMGENDYAGAAAQLDRVVSLYPGDGRVGAAALLEGKALDLAGNTGQAVQFLQAFARQHPSNASAPRALADVVQYLKASSQAAAALQAEQQLIASFPTSPLDAAAAFDVGWADYEKLDFTSAKAVWQTVLDRWPTSPGSSPALLWLGKLEQRAGNNAAAQHDFQVAWQADPGNYYAFRARDLAAGSTNQRGAAALVQPSASEITKEKSDLESWLATWTNPSSDDRDRPYLGAPISRGSTLGRIQALASMGLQDDLQNEITQAMGQYRDDGRSLFALADVLNQAGLTADSLSAAYQLLMISPAPNAYQSPVYLQRLVYPFPYRDLIEQSAQKYGVDPLLLISLIRQESTFNTRARSVTNALGLTQFEPGTAQTVAAQIGLTNFSLNDLYQPRTAIELGAAYIATETRAFGGNSYFALAAYNAGEGSVRSWLSDNPRQDLDLLVEEIPFQQTSEYVRNIYRFYQEYQLLYRPAAKG